MGRVMADCRRYPSVMNCSLVIIGEEEEVVRAAVEHAISVHEHEDNEETWEMTRLGLEPASAYTADREPDPVDLAAMEQTLAARRSG